MQSHEHQDFHKGRGENAHLETVQYRDSPSILYLKHCKTSLVVSLLLFRGLITSCPISPSHPALISGPPFPRYMLPTYNHCQNTARTLQEVHLDFTSSRTTQSKKTLRTQTQQKNTLILSNKMYVFRFFFSQSILWFKSALKYDHESNSSLTFL